MARQSTTPMEIKIAPELINQYRAEEITLQRLADLHSVSVTTIWRELKRHGICRGSRRGRPASHQKRAAVLALAERGFSRQQIADQLGVTPEWVRCILAEQGLAVSLQILKCHQCQAPIATGHKAHQMDPHGQPLCVSCLRKKPDLPLAQRLKTLRLADNLSVAQLSARSGLSRAAIGNYERGRGLPTWESARKLARGLGVSLPALVGKNLS